MTDDATLEEFLEAESDERTDTERPVPTCAWGEYTCSRCAERVERVWRDDGSVVCRSCKRW